MQPHGHTTKWRTEWNSKEVFHILYEVYMCFFAIAKYTFTHTAARYAVMTQTLYTTGADG